MKKIIYCISSMVTKAGMETILYTKAQYLSEMLNYEIFIITTDSSKGRKCFPETDKIHFIDLGIDYYYAFDEKYIYKWKMIFVKLIQHLLRLKSVIKQIAPDIIISLGDVDEWLIPIVHKNIPMVNECHFHYSYRIDNDSSVYQKLRLKINKRVKKKYDRFVVLTQSDMKTWGLQNALCIPNFSRFDTGKYGYPVQKKVIAVGRLTYQKGFDMLIEVWSIIKHKYKYSKLWSLDIYGDGEDKEMLHKLIQQNEIDDLISLKGNIANIEYGYLSGSIFVMPSRFEGFPLALIEAMSFGLVPVSFDCKQGPNEILKEGSGILVQQYDLKEFADKLMMLMENDALREAFQKKAKARALFFRKEEIMDKWDSLISTTINRGRV